MSDKKIFHLIKNTAKPQQQQQSEELIEILKNLQEDTMNEFSNGELNAVFIFRVLNDDEILADAIAPTIRNTRLLVGHLEEMKMLLLQPMDYDE